MSQIRVLIVEDEVLIAEDIKDMLLQFNYRVTDIAYTKAEAISALAAKRPDMVLLDINLEGNLEGISIAEVINRSYHIPFIYITSYANKSVLDQAKNTNPMGYIVKPFDEKDLFSTLEIAYHNFQQRVGHEFIWDLNMLNQRLNNPITEKEFEILKELYKGKTNKEISEAHFISLNTIKTHLKNLYGKLDVRNRASAIAVTRKYLKNL